MTVNSTDTIVVSKSRLRQQYRTQFGISMHILQVCMDAGSEGTIITKISRFVNLSHYATSDSCKKLVDAGLIEIIKIEKMVIYKITDKGICHFHELQQFQDFIKELNIRL